MSAEDAASWLTAAASAQLTGTLAELNPGATFAGRLVTPASSPAQ